MLVHYFRIWHFDFILKLENAQPIKSRRLHHRSLFFLEENIFHFKKIDGLIRRPLMLKIIVGNAGLLIGYTKGNIRYTASNLNTATQGQNSARIGYHFFQEF